MTRIPYIFIGSSRHAKKYVELIAGCLGSDVICSPWWHEDNFPLGESALEALCKKTVLYEFAIFVATADDLLLSEDASHRAMRDNVLFEHGLFTGALGRRRTFLFAPGGIKIPTDLAGITIIYYNPLDYIASVSDGCGKILNHIQREMSIARFSLLPSASVAVNYYQNFLLPVCCSLHMASLPIIIGEVQRNIKGFVFNAIVPEILERDYKNFAELERRKRGWREVQVFGPLHRRYCVSGSYDRGHLSLYDVPTGLSASFEAVRLFLGSDHIGAAEDFTLCMRRELECFKATLNILIQENPNTRRNARILADPDSGSEPIGAVK